jgi:endo-1,4-beta-mannosidase
VTRWLGNGQDVLFTEFGLPTHVSRGPTGDSRLVDEDAAAVYTTSALEALRDAGCLGAMLWCYSDYHPARWSSPPLDLAPHERSFGLWRADGSPKPSVAAVAAFAGAARREASVADLWIDIGPDDFLLDPGRHLSRLYGRYRSRSR